MVRRGAAATAVARGGVQASRPSPPSPSLLPACSAVLHRAARDAAAENAGGAHRGQPGQRGASGRAVAGGRRWRLIRLLNTHTHTHTHTHTPPTQMNYQYKHLVGAMIVAGWDEDDGGQVRAPLPAATRPHPPLLACTWQRTPPPVRPHDREHTHTSPPPLPPPPPPWCRGMAAPSAAPSLARPGPPMARAAPSSGASSTPSSGVCVCIWCGWWVVAACVGGSWCLCVGVLGQHLPLGLPRLGVQVCVVRVWVLVWVSVGAFLLPLLAAASGC